MMQFLFTKTPLIFLVSSFWRDEAFSYLMARLPVHQLLWSTAQDANPPLYYLLLKLWMSIFGSSEIALRSLSFLFFWATLYVIFLMMKEIFHLNEKKSLLYLLLFIINPLLHYYAFEARMYSMMAFLATLLFYTIMKKKYRMYAYTALVALFTHYFLLIVIAFQVLFVFFTINKKERISFIFPLLKAALWYFPWIVLLLIAKPPLGQSFWIAPSTWKDFAILPAIILTGYERDAWIVVSFLSYISLIICTIVIVGSLKNTTHQKKINFILLLGWALGIPLLIYLISFIKPLFLPRYLIFSSVGLTLLLIISLESIANTYIRLVAMGMLVFFLFSYSQIQVLMRTKAPLKKTFTTIRNEIGVNDVVYVTHEYDFHVAEYYLPTQKVYLYKKTYDELPWFVGKVLIDKQAFRDTLPSFPTRAFIVNNDGSYSVMAR